MKKQHSLHSILFLCTVFLCTLNSCKKDEVSGPLFQLLDNSTIGIDFNNTLNSTKEFNVYKYRNFYNGGGVALGDINGDELIDIYLVSNQNKNKLYINKGGLQFEDVSAQAGVEGTRSWSTGVSFVDINNDGLLDIYVCNSGDIKGDNKENELFINKGDLQFEESAADYGLNDKGYSTHASFFDYDKDGDLDVYLLNNSYTAIGSFNLRKNERPNRDELGGDKLMENRNGKFVDVSSEAGIYGSVIGFGLGVTVSDFNNDNWPDIFVSNDFFERDYLYINQTNGTFKEDLVTQMHSISAASMGADAADVDNDGHSDLFVTDMLPSEYERLKTVTTFDDWNRYSYNLKNGYHHQFTRNVFQRNNGNNTFSEVSRYAGVDASDWSWGALFFDMDNDGYKDLFIANGIYKDLTNQDYLQYISNEAVMKSIINEEGVNYKELIDIIPTNPVANHAYKNTDGVQFEKYEDSGLLTPSFSNGSAFGDLDNDGDLDLVVNNVNMQAFVFENSLEQGSGNYLKFNLEGGGANTYGIGSKIIVRAEEEIYQYENVPAKGFQSSIDPRPNIGVGKVEQVDVEVIWPSGAKTIMENVKVNQSLTIKESDATPSAASARNTKHLFQQKEDVIAHFHKENTYVDFNRERLIYHMRNNEGGKIAEGDLNGDGLTDLVLAGPKGQASKIYLGQTDGSYRSQSSNADLEKLKDAEHIRCALIDIDNDQDLDVYFASGGVEHSEFSEKLFDHLFLNDGQGNLSLVEGKYPRAEARISSGALAHADIDQDGDQDLFVGERIKIGKFGAAGSAYILENDGAGNLLDKTDELTEELKDIGMITDAVFADIDNDKDPDLILCGEFMEITVLENINGKFSKKKLDVDTGISGWWNDINLVDIDQDGDLDILAGNLGENSRFKASEEYPIRLYFSDFDKNGSEEGVMCSKAENGKYYPYALRHNLVDQIKKLKRRFPDFESFKDADITTIFTPEELAEATILQTDQLQTLLLLNQGNFKFTSLTLPKEVQFSPTYASSVYDFDADGDMDIVMGGNLYNVLPEMGIYDGNFGVYLENNGDNTFSHKKDGLGFHVQGEIRDLKVIDNTLLVTLSNDTLRSFSFK